MKKYIFIIMVLILMSVSLASCDNLLYEYRLADDDTYYIVSYLGNDTSITIPNTYKGKNVTAIDAKAFMRDEKIEEVTLGNNIKMVSIGAFYQSKIKKITFNEGLEVIEYAAFDGCTELETVNLEDTKVKTIEAFAFNNCTKLSIDLILPTTVKVIRNYAFQNCKSIKYVSLNAGLEEIYDGAFNHVSGAKNSNLYIPSTVKRIGGGTLSVDDSYLGTHVFYDFATTTLESFTCDNDYFKAIDGILYRLNDAKEPSVLVAYPDQKQDETYHMPNTVVDAYELSFGKNQYLKTIELSDSFEVYNVTKDESPKNYLNTGTNLSVAIYCRTIVENITTKESNIKYSSKDGVLYSINYSKLVYIPINSLIETLTLPVETNEILSGAIYINDGVEVYNKVYVIECQNDNMTVSDDFKKALEIKGIIWIEK